MFSARLRAVTTSVWSPPLSAPTACAGVGAVCAWLAPDAANTVTARLAPAHRHALLLEIICFPLLAQNHVLGCHRSGVLQEGWEPQPSATPIRLQHCNGLRLNQQMIFDN